MKRLIAIVSMFILGSGLIYAQERVVNETFRLSNNQRVVLDLTFGDVINVEAWDKNEVAFKAIIEINGGRLNDALEIDFDNSSSWLRITSDYDKEKIKQGKRRDCPDSKYRGGYWHNGKDEGSYVCSNIYYTIYVPENADIKIETISSDIELKGVRGPLDVKSISGFVDLTWDESRGADLSIKTVSGDAFTDLATLNRQGERTYSYVGIDLNAKISGGGNRVNLETISGDIFLRKRKN